MEVDPTTLYQWKAWKQEEGLGINLEMKKKNLKVLIHVLSMRIFVDQRQDKIIGIMMHLPPLPQFCTANREEKGG